MEYFFSEIFGNFQFFVEKKNFSSSLQKPPNPNPNLKKSQNLSNNNLNLSNKIPKSPNPNSNLSNLFPSITASYSCIASLSLTVSPSKNLPLQNPKNYRKTLINYRISITKMLQFCPSFGASLLQALKDSHFLPLSLASDALSRSLCTLTPPCV